MGDISAEPSMEDILSSIKRIIAEDGEGGQPGRQRRAPRTASTAAFPPEAEPDEEDGGVLELSDAAPDGSAAEPAPVPAAGPILSSDVLASSRGSLDALTRMIAKPEPDAPAAVESGKTMEAFVGELLRPLLREWLDANLPELVEAMVAKEIARITGNR